MRRRAALSILTALLVGFVLPPVGEPAPSPAAASGVATIHTAALSEAAPTGGRQKKPRRAKRGRKHARAVPTAEGVPLAQAGAPPTPGAGTGPLRRSGREVPTMTIEVEPAPDGQAMRAGSLFVKFRAKTGDAARQAAHQAAGGVSVESLPRGDAVRVQVRRGGVETALAAYRARPDVQYAEPDYIVKAMFTPDDPRLPEQYGLTRISAPAAWDRTRGSPTARIAILDCGIFSDTSSTFLAPDGRPGHPDLRGGKVVANANFTTTPDADDWCDHGTHVAGIAAAATNNGVGAAGVGFDSAVMNGKVLDDTGVGTTAWIVSGILWAADNGAKVINMSLGSSGACTAAFQDAIDYAWARGVVIVAAAGNSGANGAIKPANCNNVIAVAATDENDNKASFSNFGVNVDVAAPGVSILSTDFVGNYVQKSGTSMSAPHAAGAAALVWTTGHGTSNVAVVDRLTSAADRIAGTGTFWISGRINAAASVGTSCAATPRVSVSTVQVGPGRVQSTIRAASPGNLLRSLRFGAPRRSENALVDIGDQTDRTGEFTVDLSAGTTEVAFFVRRAATGPAIVYLIVTDECGDWPTFVGFGSGVP